MKRYDLLKLIEKNKKGLGSLDEIKLLDKYIMSFQEDSNEWNENLLGNKSRKEQNIFSKISDKIDKGNKHNLIYKVFSPVLMNKAASIIFLLIMLTGGLYLFKVFKTDTKALIWNEKINTLGEKSVVHLSDSSKVILNAGSKLKFPKNFSDDSRDVYLTGEAYFEVSHDDNHPFIVLSNKILTTVPGTKFNVSAYEENKDIAVSLIEGKVKVSKAIDDSNTELAVIKPREKLLYDKTTDKNSFAVYDSLEIIGWKDGIYKFDNVTISEVLTSMERVFKVEFDVSKKSILNQNITVKFVNSSLETMINVIESLTGLKSSIKVNNDKKNVKFY